jgi:hypothetical protein
VEGPAKVEDIFDTSTIFKKKKKKKSERERENPPLNDHSLH